MYASAKRRARIAWWFSPSRPPVLDLELERVVHEGEEAQSSLRLPVSPQRSIVRAGRPRARPPCPRGGPRRGLPQPGPPAAIGSSAELALELRLGREAGDSSSGTSTLAHPSRRARRPSGRPGARGPRGPRRPPPIATKWRVLSMPGRSSTRTRRRSGSASRERCSARGSRGGLPRLALPAPVGRAPLRTPGRPRARAARRDRPAAVARRRAATRPDEQEKHLYEHPHRDREQISRTDIGGGVSGTDEKGPPRWGTALQKVNRRRPTLPGP